MKSTLVLIVAALLFVSIAAHAGEWIADSKTNCKIWNDNPQPNETISWSGECVDGYAAGTGVNIWYKDGKESERYEGEMKKGKHDGKGTATLANGLKYEGDWVDGKSHGKGTATLANGDKYTGDFVDDKFNGKGTMTSKDGSKWTKEYSKPVLYPGKAGSWDSWLVANLSVLDNSGKYKMWYWGTMANNTASIGYAEVPHD